MRKLDLKLVKRLVEGLENEDAFARREAIERLALLTQQRMDFEWRGDETRRKDAVRRWRRWLAKQEKRRRGNRVEATIQVLAEGKIDKSAVEAALKGLPPEQKKAIIAQVLSKVSSVAPQLTGLPACKQCAQRPGTAKITALQPDGSYLLRYLCEVCASRELG